MRKKDSSFLDDDYILVTGSFLVGFVVNRLMNNQDVVTGEVKEGLGKHTYTWYEDIFRFGIFDYKDPDHGYTAFFSTALWVILGILFILLVHHIIKYVKSRRRAMPQGIRIRGNFPVTSLQI